jgi:hypothetical protein
MDILMGEDILPGAAPSYQLAKKIFAYHPLGAKIAEAPIRLAQSQDREITIPGAPEDDLKRAFFDEWKRIGNNRIESGGADRIIRQFSATSRIYGIASLGLMCEGFGISDAIPAEKWHELDLKFNIWDPLNTAGSLVLDQDPLSPYFMKPRYVQIAGHDIHASRVIVKLQEYPVWIEWSSSAFGFVGRSVYQRALYPLKSFIQSMITNNLVQEKAGILVHKSKAPGSIIDRLTDAAYSLKRKIIKGAKTGNVIQIGVDESLESVNLQMLSEPIKLSREFIIKDIASSVPMPAVLLAQETLTEGFGEGTEDSKQIAAYVSEYRIEINPVYSFFDEIVMRRAWTPTFFEIIQRKYPGTYRGMKYETAFMEWRNGFTPKWPNLLQEADSEKVKVDESRANTAIGFMETMAPMLPPAEKAKLCIWAADVANDCKFMFSNPLLLDEEEIANYEPPNPMQESEGEPETKVGYDV